MKLNPVHRPLSGTHYPLLCHVSPPHICSKHYFFRPTLQNVKTWTYKHVATTCDLETQISPFLKTDFNTCHNLHFPHPHGDPLLDTLNIDTIIATSPLHSLLFHILLQFYTYDHSHEEHCLLLSRHEDHFYKIFTFFTFENIYLRF